MIHILIPRRLRIFGFRRVSTPVLAVVLILVIVLLLITIFPTQVNDSADHPLNKESPQSWPLIDTNQVVRPELSRKLPEFRDQVLGNLWGKPWLLFYLFFNLKAISK